MRVWFACFFLLFGLSELFQWMKHLSLPLPVFILGGAFLAIASNYDRRAGFPFNVLDQALNANEPPPQTIPPAVKPQVSLPRRPISFTIRKPES